MDEENINPFDTSFIGDIAPEKAEIKFLESKLIHQFIIILSKHKYQKV